MTARVFFYHMGSLLVEELTLSHCYRFNIFYMETAYTIVCNSLKPCRANQVVPSFKIPPEMMPQHISPSESVAAQLKVIDGLSTADNGKFYRCDGSILPF